MIRNWRNLVTILTVTFVLMALMVIFTSRVIYRTSNDYVIELGNDKTAAITAELENYLETAKKRYICSIGQCGPYGPKWGDKRRDSRIYHEGV